MIIYLGASKRIASYAASARTLEARSSSLSNGAGSEVLVFLGHSSRLFPA